MLLTYPPFAAVEAIRRAASNSPALQQGDKGAGVAILQGGLIDLGYTLPMSTKKAGRPDGVYGHETKTVIMLFQKNAKITLVDGIAGKDTITALDQLLTNKAAKKIPPPKLPAAPIPLPPSDKNYVIGTVNPAIATDPGAGIFDSKPTEVTMWVLKQNILQLLPPQGSIMSLTIGFDATRHLKHYLDATGMDLTIDLEDMVISGPTAQARFRDEVSQAQQFVQTLPVGIHTITSKITQGAYNYKEESLNWFYGVGGYVSWGKGVATVKKGALGREYDMQFEYHFFDRYNWDMGKSVKIGPVTITDTFMGEFHRQGLAREFNMKGMIKRRFTWPHGGMIPTVQYSKSAGR